MVKVTVLILMVNCGCNPSINDKYWIDLIPILD
jgi:hypothetical protein